MLERIVLALALTASAATGCAPPAPEVAANKLVARRYMEEVLNRGNLSAAEDLLAPGVTLHNPPVTLQGRDALKQLVVSLRTAFPDLRFAIEDEIAEGDRAVVRWLMRGTQRGTFQGHPPGHASMEVSGIDVFRIADSRIQEIWVAMDLLGQARQLGWVPAVTPAP